MQLLLLVLLKTLKRILSGNGDMQLFVSNRENHLKNRIFYTFDRKIITIIVIGFFFLPTVNFRNV